MLTPSIARLACAQTKVDAVLPVATFGMPHDLCEWQHFEAETGLPVIIDAAAAYGSQWLQGAQGTLVFSLHATKSLPAVEGGLVVSTRPGIAAKVRQLSNFGINLTASVELPIGALAGCGTNAKMSEYHAAVCLASLEAWTRHAEERTRLHTQLKGVLDRLSGNQLRWQTQGTGGILQAPTLLCAMLPDELARERLEQTCERNRIRTRRWYQPLLHHMKAMRGHCDFLKTPNAEYLARHLLGLPFFREMTASHRDRIESAVMKVFTERSHEVGIPHASIDVNKALIIQ